MGSFVVLSLGNVPSFAGNASLESAYAELAMRTESSKGNIYNFGYAETLNIRAGN